MSEMEEEYHKVLQLIQEGVISAEEGAKLLDALDWGSKPDDQPENGTLPESRSLAGEADAFQGGPPAWIHWAWVYVLTGGVVILGLAGIATTLLVQGGSRLGWLVCTLPLIAFGALVVALAWWSRTARWLHVRIRDEGTRVNFSLPLPLRPAAWLVRLARPWVPQLRDTPVDELILSMAEMEEEGILALEVSEGDGEEVQVYFG